MSNLNEIECDLREIPEYFFDINASKLRRGKYHGSNFWDIPKFGSKCWVIAARIDMDFEAYEDIEATVEELAQACVNFLNKPPPRKKYAKRQPKPKYGILELYRARIVERKDDKYIDAYLIVKSRKESHFWGKGRLL
jgi:hypothetical protein